MAYFKPKGLSLDDIKGQLREQLDAARPKGKGADKGSSMSGEVPMDSPYAYIEDVYPDDGYAIVEVEGPNKKCYAVTYTVKGGKARLSGTATPLKEVYQQDGDPISLGDIFKRKEK